MSKELTREELSLANVQYGSQTKRWNPKMKPYIFSQKSSNKNNKNNQNQIHIINLETTISQLAIANKLVQSVAERDGKILFVGTKSKAKLAVKEAALRSGNFFVNQRWLGGTLTNMRTISLLVKKLWEIEKKEHDGRLALRPKKEQGLILKQKEDLEKKIGGIKQMRKLPAVLFVVDPKTDEIAVKEARKLNIPIIGICNTSADPDMVDICIPANDNVAESINLIINNIVDNYAEAIGLNMIPSALKTVAPKKNLGDENSAFENKDFSRKRRMTDKKDFSYKKPNFEKAEKVETKTQEESKQTEAKG